MCQKAPEPRCAGHIRKEIEKNSQKIDNIKNITKPPYSQELHALARRRDELFFEYDGTPTGQKKLLETLDKFPKDSDIKNRQQKSLDFYNKKKELGKTLRKKNFFIENNLPVTQKDKVFPQQKIKAPELGRKIKVNGLRGSLVIDPADVTSHSTQQVYMQGQCFALARSLHELTGYPLVILVRGKNNDIPTLSGVDQNSQYDYSWTYAVVHAGVRTPNGNILDVRGESSSEKASEGSAAENGEWVNITTAHLDILDIVGTKPHRSAANIAAKAVSAKFLTK